MSGTLSSARAITDRGCPLTSPRACGEGLLRCDGPHAPKTVKRRLASLGHSGPLEGLEGPLAALSLRLALRLAVRALPSPRQRKSKRGRHPGCLGLVDRDLRDGSLADARDLAILLLAFASGLAVDQSDRSGVAPWSGLELEAVSAQGLRAGYLNEAAHRGQGSRCWRRCNTPSTPRVQQAASQCNEAQRAHGRAARLGL